MILGVARARLGGRGDQVNWPAADVRHLRLLQPVDVWHDRAVGDLEIRRGHPATPAPDPTTQGKREAALSMRGYYSAALSGVRLQECYELASARVKQYLEAEIEFVLGRLRPTDSVLELGCGYGRVAHRLAAVAAGVVGIDTSSESLKLARQLARPESHCRFLPMDASALALPDGTFNMVACVQNGICAFAVDPGRLVREALRVTRPGGRVVFSSYSEEFWPERLGWFESQAAAGLVGTIDYDQTGNGTVVCKDGFRAGAFSANEFHGLCRGLDVEPVITTVDESSVFCEVLVPGAAPE